jgi:hypothetical protein
MEMEELQQFHDDIGWDDLLNGNMKLQWKETQHQYYLSLAKWNTRLRWVRLLIQKLWEVAWGQWENRNEVVHRQDNLITRKGLETINLWIREAFRLG